MSQKKFYFVYGTLKQGFGNHSLLRNSGFVGAAMTEREFVMVGSSFPYIYTKEEGSFRILGEVYEVTSRDVERALDILEGIEHEHYTKEVIQVKLLETGEVIDAHAYVAHSATAAEIEEGLNYNSYLSFAPVVEMHDVECYEWRR